MRHLDPAALCQYMVERQTLSGAVGQTLSGAVGQTLGGAQ